MTRGAGNIAGQFLGTPAGVILHGTRSGVAGPVNEEYQRTLRYVAQGAGGLGWNASVGDGLLAIHILPGSWGWNARSASSRLLAIEFAQPRIGDPISDLQIETFVWWFINVARAHWPSLPAYFPNHSDLPEGKADGKTDVESAGQDQVRNRILDMLSHQGVT